METITERKNRIIYPESDGMPMGETDFHIAMIIYLREALQDYFRNEPDVYVAGDMFLYYEEGNPQASVAPDSFVVRGVADKQRRTYKIWEEGRGPDVVFEITSRSTRRDDMETKRALYANLGVAEYYIFDPEGDYLEPPLWAFHLDTAQSPAAYVRRLDEAIYSPILGLEILVEKNRLRLRDPRSGEKLLWPQEALAARRAEAEARRAAEAEAARLRAELERLRGEKKDDADE